MNSRNRTVTAKSAEKKRVVANGLTSASTSNVLSHNTSRLVRQKTNVRASSAKYHDIASTILGGLSDVEELFLNAAKNENNDKLEQLLQQSRHIGLDINCVDKKTGNTALIWAAKRGHIKNVGLLLQSGADATLSNHEGQTTLETAFPPVRTVILDWIETQEDVGEQLLLQAAWQGNISVVRKILQKKANMNVNCQNAEGLTPLMLVCRDVQLFERLSCQLNRHYSPVQVAEELMKNKANIHVTDPNGRSCLHYVSQSHAGCADALIIALVAGGLPIDLRDKCSLTPLHLASQSGSTSNVVALAERGSNVNAKGYAGVTPLHMTAYNDHHVTAITLLKYNADVTITDDQGLTPVDIAKSKKMKNTLKEAWTAATTKSNNQPPSEVANIGNKSASDEQIKKSDSTPQKLRPEVIFDDILSKDAKMSAQSQTIKSGQPKALISVDRYKQAERKVLQEVETLKAAYMLQREATRMLGTPRAKILPDIGRSSSPEHSSTKVATDCRLSQARASEGIQMSLEEARSKLSSRGKSLLDIKIGVERSSAVSSKMNEEFDSKDDKSSKMNRTFSVPKALFVSEKPAHHRSDSDPSTPKFRDLAASCDSLLPNTKGKRIIEAQLPQFFASKNLQASQGATQKSFNHSDKGLIQPEYILQSFEAPFELIRSQSILKEEFILEESRPKDVLSGSDPTSSISGSSQSSTSPRDLSFLQSPHSRSVKHDQPLSTLVEQQASTSFSVDDVFTSSDGKPVIMKPHKRLRRRSENSLSSSVDSDVDDMQTHKLLTRSSSLRKSTDQMLNVSQEQTGLPQHPTVCKSQSMESISPKVSIDLCSSKNTIAIKCNSEGHLDSVQKEPAQINQSDFVPACPSAKPSVQSKAMKTASKCIKPSKKLIIESLSGKARILINSKTFKLDHSTVDVSAEKNVSSNQTVSSKAEVALKTQQGSPCARTGLVEQAINSGISSISLELQKKPGCEGKQMQPSLITQSAASLDTGNTKSRNGVKLQATVSAPAFKKLFTLKNEAQANNLISNSIKENTSQTGNINICLNSSSSKQATSHNPQQSPILATRESRTVKSISENSDQQNKYGGVDKQMFREKESCKTSMNEEKVVKFQSLNTTLKTDNETISQKIDGEQNLCQAEHNTTSQMHSTASDLFKSENAQNVLSKVSEPLKQNACVQISSESSTCSLNMDKPCIDKLSVLSKNQEVMEPAEGGGQQEKNKVILNILAHSSAQKQPPISLKSVPADQTDAGKLQHTASKPGFGATITHTNVSVISTPVIVNPFEEFVQTRFKEIENCDKDTMVKIKRSQVDKTGNKTFKKVATPSKKRPSSSHVRQTSAGKKPVIRVKDTKTESRPKSGKKSGKIQKVKKLEKGETTEHKVETSNANVDTTTHLEQKLSASSKVEPAIKISGNLNIEVVDVESYLEFVEQEGRTHNNNSKEESFFQQPKHLAVRETNAESSLRYTENKFKKNYLTSVNLQQTETHSSPSIKVNIVEDIHNSLDQKYNNVKHLTVVQEGTEFPKDMSASELIGIVQEESLLNVLTPIPEVLSSRTTDSSLSDNNRKELSYTYIKVSQNNEKHFSEDASSMNPTEKLDSSEHMHSMNKFSQDFDDQVNYEYTSSGKEIRRTQSLKDFSKSNNPVIQVSRCLNQEGKKESADDENIEDYIEEILSSTTSSMNSTLRSNKHNETCTLHTGSFTLTNGDKSFLLQMSASKFNSPFHAKNSIDSQLPLEDAVCDLSKKGDSSACGVSEDDDDESLPSGTDKTRRTVDSDLATAASVHDSAKPPQPIKSCVRDKGISRPVAVGRSKSTRERGRHSRDKNNTLVTEEEAKQLAKVLSSFRHMELHTKPNSQDKLSGSSKNVYRNTRQTLGLSPPVQPASESSSFRSRGKFLELKDDMETRLSNEMEKGDEQCLGAYFGNTSVSECVSRSSYDEDYTIQWKKGNILGRGAFGIVWCGLTSEGQLIAVKQIELTTMDKSKAHREYEKIQEEVELLKTLEHVNIVSYLGTSLDDSIVSIFMQFIPGGSIASILARFGALEESVLSLYTKQILEGVIYLHSNDVIHRDIKGANVMLMPNGVIKLIDFGCAKRLCINLSMSQTQLLKSMNGTPFWMAPEVVNETGHGKKSDIWSIGCTVFEMATRKPPWSGMNPMAAIFAIGSPTREVPTLDSKFSQDTRDFVSLCMTRDQDIRPGAIELRGHPFITRQASTRPSRSDA